MQSGAIELLRSDSLRLRIIEYAAVVAAGQEVLRRTEDQTWRNAERTALEYRRPLLTGSARAPSSEAAANSGPARPAE